MKIRTKEVTGGYTLEIVGYAHEQILSITSNSGAKVSLNDTVMSNGRYGVEEGLIGRVVFLEEPHADNNTNDVYSVVFENGESATLKCKGLVYKNGSYNIKNW